MIFQGIDRDRAEAAWQPFTSWIAAQGGDYTTVAAPMFFAAPAQYLWDAEFLKKNAPQIVLGDDRPGAPEGNVFWRTNQEESGWCLHGYGSTWMPGRRCLSRRASRSSSMRCSPPHAAGRRRCISTRAWRARRPRPSRRRAIPRPTLPPPMPSPWPSSPPRGRPQIPGIAGHEPDMPLARRNARRRRRDGRTAQAGAESGLLRIGRIFRSRLAERLPGGRTIPGCGGQGQVDPEGLFFIHFPASAARTGAPTASRA